MKRGVAHTCEKCEQVFVCWDGTDKCPECNHVNAANERIKQRTWPMKSEALGVQPNQVNEAYKESVSIGIPTEFDKDGKAIFTSPSHYKKYAEAHGYYAKNGGYSDPRRGARKWF